MNKILKNCKLYMFVTLYKVINDVFTYLCTGQHPLIDTEYKNIISMGKY